MTENVQNLLNFTLDQSLIGSSPIISSHQKNETSRTSNLLVPEFLNEKSGNQPRKSLDNNPFDRVCKQVETFSSDPFEFVAAQSKNFKPVISCIRTGNLIDLGGDNSFNDKENNNNNNKNNSNADGKNESNKSSPGSNKKVLRRSKSLNESSCGKKRENLLKISIVNATKTAMTNDFVAENLMGEKWANLIHDDSCNDLMKQDLVLVDSDNSVIDVSNDDFETELNIPILKELEQKKSISPEIKKTDDTKEIQTNNSEDDNRSSIIDRAIAKLNEIKMAKSREMNLDDTMSKLKQMISKVDGDVKGEASQLLDQLFVALEKKQTAKNKNSLEPPPVMVRQGTFDIDKEEDDSIDISNNSEHNSPQIQSVIEKLSEALGSVNLNIIQPSPDNTSNVKNPVVVLVVNPESNYGMSETVTIDNRHYSFNTPQPQNRTRRSQSFSSTCRPNTVAPNLAARRESIAFGTPQRSVQPTRRSFSFNSPAPKNPVQKRVSILPSTSERSTPAALKSVQTAPVGLNKLGTNKTGVTSRLSFMDKIKPKIGFTNKSQNVKPASLKPTGPLKVVHRERSPNSTIKSLSASVRQTPMAQSTPMSRLATPQKPTRVSFLTPSKPTPTTLTIPKPGTQIKRHSSFNDKERATSNLKPSKPNSTRPNTGGLLTQRKFPLNKPTTATTTGTTSTQRSTLSRPTQRSLTLKLKK